MKKYFIPVILLVAIIYNVVVFLATSKHTTSFGYFTVSSCWDLSGFAYRTDCQEGKPELPIFIRRLRFPGSFGRLPCFFL